MQKALVRKCMKLAVKTMKNSVSENRADGKVSPAVGAVIVLPNGAVHTAFRSEIAPGDHAEFTLLQKKLEGVDVSGATLFATLEPCAPGARKHPKQSCAQWIAQGKISTVYIGCIDPDPTVANQGIKYLEDFGIKIVMFDKDLQDEIYEFNRDFFAQAKERASMASENTIAVGKIDENELCVDMDLLDNEAVDYYCRISETPKNEFLARLDRIGLIVDNKFNNQALILFGKEPGDMFTQVGIKVKKTVGGALTFFEYSGPMVLAISKIKAWYEANMPYISDRSNMIRTNKYIYPFDEILREALVNAIVHRDYNLEGALIHFDIDEREIIIKSPGNPINGITFEQIRNFNAPSRARNSKIAFIFNRMHLMERSAVGMYTFKNIPTVQNLPIPIYYMDGVNICLKFYVSFEARDIVLQDTVLGQLNKDEIAGYNYIKKLGKITKEEYTKYFGWDISKTKRHLSKMSKLDLILLVDMNKNSFYIIK